MRFRVKLFFIYSAVCFVLASVGYFTLQSVMPQGYVFGVFFRMILYHWHYPLQYIALISFFYGVTATLWAEYYGHLKLWKRFCSILGMFVVTILLSSAPGGILWKIHDMQAGFFPSGQKLWSDLTWGASQGIFLGWLIIALSIPYNFLGVIIGYVATDKIQKSITQKTL